MKKLLFVIALALPAVVARAETGIIQIKTNPEAPPAATEPQAD